MLCLPGWNGQSGSIFDEPPRGCPIVWFSGVVRSALTVYLAVEIALLASAIATTGAVRGALSQIVVLIGTTTLTVSVARRKPEPMAAWWLVVAGAWTVLGQAVATTVAYGLRTEVTLTAIVPVLLTLFPFPLLAIALALLARATARRGMVDALDATMVALAVFLLLWVFALETQFEIRPGTAPVVVVLPITALVAFAMALRLAFGGGMRDPATALLLVVVGLLLATTLGGFVLDVESSTLGSTAGLSLLWSAHGLLLGLIAVLPSFSKPRRPGKTATYDMSLARVVLFSLLVLVPLVAWAHNSFGAGSRAGPTARAVALAFAGVFLLVLVIRLALLAQLAQRRADDLRTRSGELASAISEQAALQHQLRYQATHDPLTGLANRSALSDRLTEMRDGGRLVGDALLMLDLDGFKRINDMYGHPAGDELLIQTAQRLVTAAPERATLARLGGDEFVILIEDADRAVAERTAELVVRAVRQPYQVDRQRLQISASVGGVVVTNPQDLSSAQLIREADAALYEAKEAGRDRAVVRERGGRGDAEARQGRVIGVPGRGSGSRPARRAEP